MSVNKLYRSCDFLPIEMLIHSEPNQTGSSLESHNITYTACVHYCVLNYEFGTRSQVQIHMHANFNVKIVVCVFSFAQSLCALFEFNTQQKH